MLKTIFGIDGVHSCYHNFIAAMDKYGFSGEDIDWGSCVSVFMEMNYKPDGTFVNVGPTTKAGDYIDFMAEMEIIVALSNCPDYLPPTNDNNPTSMMAVIFDPDNDYQAKVKALKK